MLTQCNISSGAKTGSSQRAGQPGPQQSQREMERTLRDRRRVPSPQDSPGAFWCPLKSPLEKQASGRESTPAGFVGNRPQLGLTVGLNSLGWERAPAQDGDRSETLGWGWRRRCFLSGSHSLIFPPGAGLRTSGFGL